MRGRHGRQRRPLSRDACLVLLAATVAAIAFTIYLSLEPKNYYFSLGENRASGMNAALLWAAALRRRWRSLGGRRAASCTGGPARRRPGRAGRRGGAAGRSSSAATGARRTGPAGAAARRRGRGWP